MHGLGQVFHVINILEKLAAGQELTQIGSATLGAGEASGILPDHLTDCWNYASKRFGVLHEAELLAGSSHRDDLRGVWRDEQDRAL